MSRKFGLINNKGNKNIFFEIIKIYNDAEKENVGMAIDLYNSLISNPGTYMREYLVFPEFLEKSLKENCGLELVESELFINLFHLYKNYFIEKYTENLDPSDFSAKRHNEIRDFYLSLDTDNNNLFTMEQNDVSLASFKLSMLNRYYIFKKTSQINITEPSRIVGINHQIDAGKILMPYFDRNNILIDPSKKNIQINKIYHAMRKQYHPMKPSVYLIRHSIQQNRLEDQIFRKNKIEFSRIKEGDDPKVLLIYKSPEKYFYPIYYQHPNNWDGDMEDYLQRQFKEDKEKMYLLDSEKILDDLKILVALSNKLN